MAIIKSMKNGKKGKQMKNARVLLDAMRAREIDEIKRLGEKVGYGNMMATASDLWRQSHEKQYGFSGGEHIVGPCKIGTVECGCKKPHKCDWCNGCGWLTKHVKNIKDATQKKN